MHCVPLIWVLEKSICERIKEIETLTRYLMLLMIYCHIWG